ncbi:MAG: flagellar hook-basal body protein [Chloroflexi bacterium]|nr:flagellar hook-basal body protein [Chloroflexota bacterium]
MIKGLYSAFSSMEAAWKYQDVLANNVANANTAGFKREVASQESFADVLLSQQTPVVAPLAVRIQGVVGQIGTGQFVAEFATDYTQGALEQTGNELDLAANTGFFAVQSPTGQVFYTRDGRFNRDAAGDLVTSQGNYVLGADGGRLNIGGDPVAVTADGAIANAAGDLLGQLQVLDFSPTSLKRAGEAYFTSTAQGQAVNGGIRQGFIERSNSNLVDEMTSLLAVQRTFQANQTIIAKLDSTLDQAAGSVGQFGGR